MLHRSFKPAKCKTSLKLAVARLKLLKNKREVTIRQMKKDLAHLLETGQEKTAMIRVEHVVREEKTMAAYDFIDIYCELVATRLPIIESQKTCPIDLKEAVSSLIFAAPRCADIPELVDVRKHFTAKYGKDFVTSSLELRPNCGVNRTVVENLSARAPDGQTKLKILTEVAKEHNVNWDAEAFGEKEHKPPEDLLRPMESSPSHAPSHGQGFERTNFQTSHVPTQSPAQPDASGGLDGGSKYTRHSSQNSDEFAPNRQNWNMEFKDAKSAAQAAAESAEKASLAARAAAEFANIGMSTGQYMGSQEPTMRDQQRHRNERESPQGVPDSMSKSEDDTRRNTYSASSVSSVSKTEGDLNRTQKYQQKNSSQVDFDSDGRQTNEPEKTNIQSSQNVRRRNSHLASSVSGVSDIDGDLNRTHKYQQRGSSEVDFDNNGRQTKRPDESNIQSSHSVIGSVNHLRNTNSVGEGVRRQSSRSFSSDDENSDVMSVPDLPKHGSNGGDNFFDSSTANENMQSGTKQPSFNSYSSVVFDEPVSEDEITEHKYGFHDPFPAASSTSLFSENINNLSPGQSMGRSPSYDGYTSVVYDEPVFDDTATVHEYGFSSSPGNNSVSQFLEDRRASKLGRVKSESPEETSTEQSQLFTESTSPAEFVESINNTSPSQSADLLPVTFDDSDGMDPESEEETRNADFSGRTESVDQLHHRNSFTRSPESPKKAMPNFPVKEVKVVNRRPWLDSSSDDSDFDSAEAKRHHTYSSVGTESRKKTHELGDSFNVRSSFRQTKTANKLASGKEASYSPVFEEKPQSIRSSRYSLDQNVRSGGDSLALGSSEEVQDGEELDLGRLRGGIRNKGYTRPPYRKQQPTDNSDDEQVKSPVVRTNANSDTFHQDTSNHNQQLRAPRESRLNNSRTTFDSESDEAEVAPPQVTSRKGEYVSRLSRRTRDSTASSVVSSPSASTSRTRIEKFPDRDESSPKSFLALETNASAEIPAKSTGSRRSFRTNYSAKQSPDSQPQSRYQDNKTDMGETNLPVERQPSKSTQRTAPPSQSSAVEDPSSRPQRTTRPSQSSAVEDPSSRPQRTARLSQSSAAEDPSSRPQRTARLSQSSAVEDPSSRPQRTVRPSQSSAVEDSSSRPHGTGKVETLKQSGSSKEPVSRENSLKKAGHVHPKLPDYDSFAAHFQKRPSQ